MENQIEKFGKVEEAVKRAKGVVSPADLSAETGYSFDEVNEALNRLLELYESKASMNYDTGELVFRFKYPFVKRGSKSIKERLYSFSLVLWKIFKAIYKASIAVILVVYTVVFAIILLFLMSRGGGDDRDSGGRGGGAIVSGIFRALWEALWFTTISREYQYVEEKRGFKYKQYKPEKNKGKKFIQSVFHFVFGPDRPKRDPLEDDKEAVAYIRNNGYKLTSAKIIELTGVDYDEADSRLAKYISKYGGEPRINTDGVLVVEFPRLENKASDELEGGKIEYYKDEIEPPYELTGNSVGRNIIIIVMNTFNLIMSIVAFKQLTMYGLDDNAFLIIALVYFPAIFSITFYIIHLLRIPYVISMQSRRERNIIRKKLIGFIAKRGEIGIYENELFDGYTREENKNEVLSILRKLNFEIGGEMELSDNGEIVYKYPRLSRELAEMK